MREIKYRALYKPEFGKAVMYMEFGSGTEEMRAIGFNECIKRYVEDDNWVIMQYIGLQDKNGEDIYEGYRIKINIIRDCSEISSVEPDIPDMAIIEFKDGIFGIDIGEGCLLPLVHIFHLSRISGISKVEIEVIGNIYEK